jgi:hypothetical protein
LLSSMVEMLAEPVGTEGWTNDDLLVKWGAHPRIYFSVLSGIPEMLLLRRVPLDEEVRNASSFFLLTA